MHPLTGCGCNVTMCFTAVVTVDSLAELHVTWVGGADIACMTRGHVHHSRMITVAIATATVAPGCILSTGGPFVALTTGVCDTLAGAWFLAPLMSTRCAPTADAAAAGLWHGTRHQGVSGTVYLHITLHLLWSLYNQDLCVMAALQLTGATWWQAPP